MAAFDMEDPQEKVESWLSVEFRLTIEQMADLDPHPIRTKELKPFFPKKDRPEYERKGAASRYQKLCLRMFKAGILDRGNDPKFGDKFVYWLAPTKRNREKYPHLPYVEWIKSDLRRDHEDACAAIFVAVKPYIRYWDNKWTQAERQRFDDLGLAPYDRRWVTTWDELILIEEDHSNEPIYDDADRDRYDPDRWRKSINGKVDRYLRFTKNHPQDRFRVLFATKPGKFAVKAEKRANDLVRYFLARGLTRGQFVVTTHGRLTADPMGAVILQPGLSYPTRLNGVS